MGIYCVSTYLTLLISKASFSAQGRVQLPQDCQIRLSLVASPHLDLHRLYTLMHEVCLYLMVNRTQILLALTNVFLFFFSLYFIIE